MRGLDSNTCNEVTLKLSGLIGVFDLIVQHTTGERQGYETATMSDFAYYISKELQGLYEKVAGVEYNN